MPIRIDNDLPVKKILEDLDFSTVDGKETSGMIFQAEMNLMDIKK